MLEFLISCIEGVAEALGIPGEQAYRLLDGKTDILTGYLVPSYDVLHTQSREYVVEDLIGLLRERKALP